MNDSTAKFSLYQTIDTIGAYDFEYFTIADKHYLAVANFESEKGQWKLESVIYQWNGQQFDVLQNISTNGATSFKFFKAAKDEEELFLAVTNYRDGDKSVIYKWSGRQFEKFQEIETEGAQESTAFVIDDDIYIAFANFQNSQRGIFCSLNCFQAVRKKL